MVRNHVKLNIGSGWHCSWQNRIWAEVGIEVGVAVGVKTEFIYSILLGPKSCNIEYRQWLALQLVKLDMA